MPLPQQRPQPQQPREEFLLSSSLRCPVCNALMVEQRGNWRCSRCSFSLCLSCGAGYDEDGLPDASY
jgi:hypothetical protein